MSTLATLADVKEWLKVTSSTDDDLLSNLIISASAFIESWVSRSFSRDNYTAVVNGSGSVALPLENYPVLAVSSVVVDGQSIPPAANSTQSGYMFDRLAVYLVGGRRFNKGTMNVSVSYAAGYDEIPADVAQACVELVGKKYRERDRIGQTSKTLAGEIVSFSPSDLSKEAKSMLRSYQKVVPT